LGLGHLAVAAARRNPLRSTLTIGLIAAASFLIAAVSAFRVSPDESGTGGFDFVATSNQPLFVDLNTIEGRRETLLSPNEFPSSASVVSFRLKPGDDASCNNPFQVAQPRVIGVPLPAIDQLSDPNQAPLAWSGVLGADRQRPWGVLAKDTPAGEPIPAVIDKNTAWYSLKVFRLGSTFDVAYDSGERVTFRLVGLLNNTILQGSILISEADFVRSFPGEVGYRYFLVRAAPEDRQATIALLENDLGDQGFDGQSAEALLAGLLAVQNTYLSTFQALGALGLLLGTFGLAAVQLRTVLERRRELGLLRAVGFSDRRLVRLVFLENLLLLVTGLAVGSIAAGVAVLPHWIWGDASIPWGALAVMFVLVGAIGWLTVFWSARYVLAAPLLSALREP
jgi:hypothetical protein